MTEVPPMPETVGGYVVERELGHGGMGRVYLGRHEGLDRLVALKVLQPKLADEQEFVDRFMREARAAAKFSHPNVVTVFDTGIDDKGVHFIAFEFVHGGTAEGLLEKQGKIDEQTVVTIALGVAEALAFAESQGIVHRDVKPENILLTPEGVPKLADLGLAKQIENDQSNLTQTGMVLGTPLYMSPEQALGDPLDIRSDVYSLGLCMWRMLTGLTPFDEDRSASSLQIINRHINQDLPNVREREPQLSADVAHVIERMSARETADRYANANDVVKDLRRLHTGAPLADSGMGAVNRPNSTRVQFADSNPSHRSGITAQHETPPQPVRPSSGRQASSPTLGMDQVVLRPREATINSLLPFVVVLLAIVGAVGYGIYARGDTSSEPEPTQPTPPPTTPTTDHEPDVDPVPVFDPDVGARERIGRLATELRNSLTNLSRAKQVSAALREQIANFYEEEADTLDETEQLILDAFEQLLDALDGFADDGPDVEAMFAGSVNQAVSARDDARQIEERCKAISQIIHGLDPVSSRRLEQGLLEAASAYDRDAVEGLLVDLPEPRADALGRLQELALDVAVAHVLRGYARSHMLAKRPASPPNWLTDPRPALRGEELFAILDVAKQLRNPGGLTPEERQAFRQAVEKAHLAMHTSLLGALTRPSVAPVYGFLQVLYPDNTPTAAALAFATSVEHAQQTPLWLRKTRPLRDGARNTFLGGGIVIFLPKPPTGSQALRVKFTDEGGRITETRVFEAHRLSTDGGGGHLAIERWPTPAWVTVRLHNGEAGITISEGLGARPILATAAKLPKVLGVERVTVQGPMPHKAYLVDGLALPPPTWPDTLPPHPSDQARQPAPPFETPDGRPVRVDAQGRPLGPDNQPLPLDRNGNPIFPPPPNGQGDQGRPPNGQRQPPPRPGGQPGGGRGGRGR